MQHEVGLNPKRLAISTVPLLLALSGVGLLIASPFAWGAGDSIQFPSAWTTVVGAVYGVMGIAVGGTTAWMVFRRMQTRIEVVVFQLGAGIMFPVMALVQLLYILDLPRSSAYGTCVWNAPVAAAQRGARENCLTTDLPFLTQPPLEAIAVAIGLSVLLALPAYAYIHAVSKEQPSHFDRQDDERDAIGEILRGS